MRFECIDRIVESTRGDRIVAVKVVTRSEEYLADHFPTFPVLPGVLMLEVLVEAGAWLVREAQDFASSVILLREAKNVVFKSFVRPGDSLKVEVVCRRLARGESDFEGAGYCREVEVVKARFGLIHFCLSERSAAGRSLDERLTDAARVKFEDLRR